MVLLMFLLKITHRVLKNNDKTLYKSQDQIKRHLPKTITIDVSDHLARLKIES